MDEKCSFYFDVDYSSDFNDYNYDSKDNIIDTCGNRGPKRLNFLQLNYRNCQAVMHEVEEVISAGGFDIVVLQEPSLQKGFEVNGYHSFIPRGATAKVCTLVAVGLQVFHLSRFDTEHLIALSVGSRQMSCGLIVLNAYFQYNSNHKILITQIDNVVLYDRHLKILLCADSNANSPLWLSKKEDYGGKLFCEFLLLRSFKICNKRSDMYTSDSVLGTSNIDITASTDNMWRSVIDWRVTDDVVGSEHKSITFSINIDRFNKGNSENRYVGSENKIDETKYNYKKTDWERFKRILEAHLAEDEGSPANPWGTLHRQAAGKTKNKMSFGNLERNDGSWTTSWKESAELLLERFFLSDEEDACDGSHQHIRELVKSYQNCSVEGSVTRKEISRCLKRSKNSKAPDSVLYEHLKVVQEICPDS